MSSTLRRIFYRKRKEQNNTDTLKYVEDGLSTDNRDIFIDKIIDKRKDGPFVYYYVKKRLNDEYVYEWTLEEHIRRYCSVEINNFNQNYSKIQKLKKKHLRNKKKNRSIFSCACVVDSPLDANRSFRGSICDL